jgi:hypothetical protein
MGKSFAPLVMRESHHRLASEDGVCLIGQFEAAMFHVLREEPLLDELARQVAAMPFWILLANAVGGKPVMPVCQHALGAGTAQDINDVVRANCAIVDRSLYPK